MKDLTDFLSSPTKTSKDSNSPATEDEKSSKTDKNNLKIQNNEDPNTTRNKKKGRKKKIKRKPSDPAVKNIVDLLSNSLCIISPNRTPNDQSAETSTQRKGSEQKEKQGKTIESDKVVILEDDTSQGSTTNIGDDRDDCSQSKNKRNAFQFMMESRNKSIGQNSSGKNLPEDSKTDEEKEKKEVLSARKNLLENWASKRGAAKRKREEEEKDEIINLKLKRRAKRLKKLLNVDQPNNTEDDSIDVVITKTKKRVKQFSSSSSENTKDSVILLHDQSDAQIPVLEVIDENAQDEILSESKPKERKQTLLNFFGVANKTKKVETIEIQDDSVDEKEVQKIKLNSISKKKKSDHNTGETKHHIDESNNEISMKKKKKTKKHKKHENEMPKTPKNGSKLDNEDSFTPRSAKSWKLKIKINDGNSEKVPEVKKSDQKRPQRSKRVTDYTLLLGDGESSNEGETVVRRVKTKTKSVEVVVCSDDESNKKTEPSKPLKVAPVFAKATPKPKLAPEVAEARKQFLMSGIPDSLKRAMEKHQSVEETEYDVFPAISHVQQKCDKPFWHLPKPQLNLKDCPPLKLQKPTTCMGLTNSHIADSVNIQREVEKVDKLKTLLNRIKTDNPNYPVYKSFRLISEKSGKKQEIAPKPKKRRSKSVEILEDFRPAEPAMWTDKYKPKCSDDIVGNSDGVKNLKNWLELWKNFSDEINAKRKRKRGESSDSDFESTDCDSRDSTRLPGSTVVVAGPCGSGKSTAVYAICKELGFSVLELNASSKRTGKRLLQELQEATQSHQVRKKEQNVQDFFQSKDVKKQTDKKLCVLLIEDVDIVFDQDEGFVSALGQLVSTSKRPIILTTTDPSPTFVQKFISQYEYVTFMPLSSQSLATWLQILCLVEGLFVNQSDIGALLEYNKGDARKTLLELQFWVQSGGQIVRDDLLVKTSTKIVTMEQKVADDEQEPVLEEDAKETTEIFVHSNCINSFEIFKHHKPYRVPYRFNLGLLWWNVPNILGISFSEERIKKLKENRFESSNAEEKLPSMPQNTKLSVTERQKLNCVAKLYDSLAFTDVSFRAAGHLDDLEPGLRNFDSTVKNSLELGENLDAFNDIKDFTHELTHNLVNGYVDEFSRIENGETVLNIAVPEKAERRWRAKVHVCEDVLLEALPLSTHIERRSVALDYMPYLRNMSRSESRRAANNNKRGNRFRNYLRTLGINYNDNTLKLACNILIDDL